MAVGVVGRATPAFRHACASSPGESIAGDESGASATKWSPSCRPSTDKVCGELAGKGEQAIAAGELSLLMHWEPEIRRVPVGLAVGRFDLAVGGDGGVDDVDDELLAGEGDLLDAVDPAAHLCGGLPTVPGCGEAI